MSSVSLSPGFSSKSLRISLRESWIAPLHYFTKFWQMVSKVCFKFPKFATYLAISLCSCQSNCKLANKVVNFMPNFVEKLRSSLQVKFAPFSLLLSFAMWRDSFVIILPNQTHIMAWTSLATNFATSQRSSTWNSRLHFQVRNLINH